MTVKEIRDKLVEQRTMRQNAIKESEKLCQEITQLIASIDEESMEVLRKYEFDLAWLKSIEVDRLKTDEEYKERIHSALTGVCGKLQKFLEEQLE